MADIVSLDGIFKPASVAVVGASTNPDKTGHIILRNIIGGGYPGRIFPVNPGADEVLGLAAYPSVADIPGAVDLVIVVVPARAVLEVMRQAGEKGATGAIIITGGFKESGNEDLEREVVDIARSNGIRVVGPNCQGVNYTSSRLCASWPLVTGAGKMAVISQSGTVGAAISGWASADGIGISACVSLGNKADVSELDLIDYFANDPDTAVISMYVEGTGDGRKFMDACSRALKNKPVVVLRPGRSAKGRKAAESHTKSIAGSHAVFRAACKQVGVVSAGSVEELYDFSKILAMAGVRRHKGGHTSSYRVAILTSSGGSGILAADCAADVGIDLPELGDDTVARLREVLPSHCVIRNPLDLTGDTSAERYGLAMAELSASEQVDAFLLIFGDPIPRASEEVARTRAHLEARGSGVELAACYIGGGELGHGEVAGIHAAGVAVFPTPERAMRAIGALAGRF